MMDGALPGVKRFADATFLSIAAGRTVAFFAKALGEVGGGRAFDAQHAGGRRAGYFRRRSPIPMSRPAKRQACEALLAAVGAVEWVEDEGLIDCVTAVSGSGPAYVFLLAETLAEAGVAVGLPRDLAERLARATVAGAGELLRQSPESAAQLRENVTSPKGTTFAALQVLQADAGLPSLMKRAVAAAAARSRELAG